MGRQFIAESDQAFMLGKEYQTIVCMEGPVFYTLYGVARIGKDCNKISGDNFMMRELGGGKLAVALSDGMGSGEKACRESTLVMELLEELLEAGFPAKAAIQMINTTLVMGREEIHFSTVDLSMFDLYTGECRLIKAGASSTFIQKRKQSGAYLVRPVCRVGVMHSIRNRICAENAGRRRFCCYDNGRCAGCSPGWGTGPSDGNDHWWNDRRKSQRACASHSGAGIKLDRRRTDG